jgi:thymidylate synthase ThyX
MSKINATVLADNLSPQGDRLITMKVTFPRIILAEFNTHRMFSRNSASSRAIPFEKMVKSVQENPFIPIAWQKNHKGMQGTEYFNDSLHIEYLVDSWLEARDEAVRIATDLNENAGVTKQLCNRLLEPFMWHTVLVTANETAFNHFFELRCSSYDCEGQFFSSKKVVKSTFSYSIYLKIFYLIN